MNDKTNREEYYQLTKIFVVDDSDLSRQNMVKLLEDNNFNVVGQASGAKECLETMGNEPNLFIVDVVMPETSGIELTKVITNNIKDVFVIMVSSLTQEHVLIESISAGAKDFLIKPFKSHDLIQSVEKISEQIRKKSFDDIGVLMIFSFLKYSLAFFIFFVMLSIPLNDKPLFNHLNDITHPLTKSILNKVERQTLSALSTLKDFGKKLFSNATPTYSDSISVKKSAISRNIPRKSKPQEEQIIEDVEEEVVEVKNSVWDIEEEAEPFGKTKTAKPTSKKRSDRENHTKEDQKKLSGLLKSDS